jgi:multiple sugar transport system substrate-binding protein
MRTGSKRWQLVVGAATAVAVVAATAPGALAQDASAPASSFDWQRFAGQEITIVATQNPWQAALEPLIPEFQELTGMTVNFESLPEQQFRQRLQVELTAGSDDIDGFMTAVLQDGARFTRAGWYEDLAPYPQDPSITSPDYGFTNFGEGLISGHTIDGTLIGMPVLTDVEMLYYRKDLLEAAGVAVPTTLDEFQAALGSLDDPDSGVRAWGSRGKGAAAVTQMSTFLYNFGVDWTDETGHAGFNNPDGVAAFDFYGRNLREHGPVGVAAFSWEELMPLFQQRQLAFWNDSSSFLGQVTDPSASADVENIGFAQMPAGPGGNYNSFFPWALAISSLSQNKAQTWYFIQWATSADIVNRLQAAGVAGARTDTVFPETVPAEWVQVFQANLEIARPKLPVVVPVPEVRDAIGAAIVTSIQGGDVAAAVAQAAQEFDRAVDAAQ